MDTVSTLDPSQRQVLVNLGNRYVVFGPSSALPQPLRFDPETDTEVLPRVADESEVAGARIAQTLRVPGMQRLDAGEAAPYPDVELLDDDGNRILVDIKVRERDLSGRDRERALRRLHEAADSRQTLEIWHFNIERLKLEVLRLGRSGLQIDELTPLDVWEKTANGVINRAQVLDEVQVWERGVGDLYENVRTWLGDNPDLRCEQSRTVAISEWIMQQFAIADRNIPVLDVVGADEVTASFVPRGVPLLLGSGAHQIVAWGRVDVITRDRTHGLVALRRLGNLQWRLASADGRQRTVAFDKAALLALLGHP